MSEYSRRILAFSAIAIALGIGISVGIAVLPINAGTVPSNTSETVTQTSTLATTLSATNMYTSTMISSSSSIPATALTTVASTTGVTSISSATTVVSTVTSISSGTESSTAAVSSGIFSITAISLNVGVNSSTLDITLQAVGGVYIGSATVEINNTIIGTPPVSMSQPPGNIMLNIQPNQSSTIVLVVPNNTITIQKGLDYYLLVYAWLGTPGEPTNVGMVEPAHVTAT